jgi:hypothetical protein
MLTALVAPSYPKPVPDFEVVPSGLLEGAIVASIEFAASPPPIQPSDLLQTFLARRVPGVRGVIFRGAVPWGREDLDRALLYLGSSEAFSEGLMWCCRRVTAEAWPTVGMHWVIDVSELVSAPAPGPEIVERLAVLPFVPQPAELVCVDPHPSNLYPAVLDEVATRLDTEYGGWIYLTDPSRALWHAAVKAVAGCSSRWNLRRRTREQTA